MKAEGVWLRAEGILKAKLFKSKYLINQLAFSRQP